MFSDVGFWFSFSGFRMKAWVSALEAEGRFRVQGAHLMCIWSQTFSELVQTFETIISTGAEWQGHTIYFGIAAHLHIIRPADSAHLTPTISFSPEPLALVGTLSLLHLASLWMKAQLLRTFLGGSGKACLKRERRETGIQRWRGRESKTVWGTSCWFGKVAETKSQTIIKKWTSGPVLNGLRKNEMVLILVQGSVENVCLTSINGTMRFVPLRTVTQFSCLDLQLWLNGLHNLYLSIKWLGSIRVLSN